MDALASISLGSTPRHPPYHPAALALVIATLLAGPAMAADFSTPLRFDGTNAAVTGLVGKQIDVTSSTPAISLHGVDFVLGSVMLRNASGAGVDVDGAHLTAAGLDATTQGSGAFALRVSGQGRTELTGFSTLQTTGGRSPAVALDNAQLQMSDTHVQTLGVLSPGIDLGSNSLLQVERSQIETFDMTSAGIRESGNALAALVRDSQVHTHQAESVGVFVSTSTGLLSLENTQVLTEAAASDGVVAQDGSHVALSQGSSVHTRGDNAPALRAIAASRIDLSDGELFSEGARSPAAKASGTSSISLLRSQALAVGPQSAVMQIQNDSRISATDSHLGNVDGSSVVFSNQRAGAPGRLDLSHSTLSGPSALVDMQSGSQGVVTLADSQLLAPSARGFQISPASSLTVNATNSRIAARELASVDGDGLFSLTAAGGSLSGDTRIQAPASGRLDLSLSDSSWQFVGDSAVSNLTLDRSSVFFAGSGYQVLTVHGDLGGNGRFLMKTDLATTQGDLLSVQGQVSGQHELVVADSGHDAQGVPLRVVGSNGGAGQFRLSGGYVDAGAFRYGLQRQGNDWYLAQVGQVVPIQPLAPARPQQLTPTPSKSTVAMTPLNPSLPPHVVPTPHRTSVPMTALTASTKYVAPTKTLAMSTLTPATPARLPSQPQRLSKGANAALGMQTAAANLWQNELGTLTQRLGELRLGNDQGGLWTRAMGGEMEVDSSYNRAFDQNMSGMEIGADRGLEQGNGTLFLGGMLGAGHSDQDFGEHASGDIDSRSIGLYATYVGDDGWYLDSVLKYDHLKGDVQVARNIGGRVRGHYDADAYGASAELGRQISLGNGWFVEPQVQVAAAHLQGPQYTSDDGLAVDADAVDSVQARVGGRLGRSVALASGAALQGYLSASWVDELAGDSDVTVDGHTLENQLPGSHADLGAGAALQVSQRQKLMLEAHHIDGHEVQQPLALTLGYRFLW